MTASFGFGPPAENVVEAAQRLMASLQAHSYPLQQLSISRLLALLIETVPNFDWLSFLLALKPHASNLTVLLRPFEHQLAQSESFKLATQALALVSGHQSGLATVSCCWFAWLRLKGMCFRFAVSAESFE